MNQDAFLHALESGLAPLREAERRQALDYYAELIADGVENGLAEEDVIAGFGAPEQIAAQLCAEAGRAGRQPGGAPAEALREYVPEGPIHTVTLQTRYTGVRVVPSADGRVRIWFAPRAHETVTAREADGVFQFIHKPSLFGSNGWVEIFCERREAVLELPQGFAGTACAQTANAALHAERLTLGGKLQLVTSNSGIAAEQCACGTLMAKTSNSGVRLSDVTAEVCEVASSNGRIAAERCALGTFLAKTSNAGIQLCGASGESCEAVTDNARVTAEQCRFAERLWLTTSNGPIHVQRIAARDVSLSTTNGVLKGTLLGRAEDYAITSRTSNAKNNLRDSFPQGGPNRLHAVTSNGRIALEFLGDAPPAEETRA